MGNNPPSPKKVRLIDHESAVDDKKKASLIDHESTVEDRKKAAINKDGLPNPHRKYCTNKDNGTTKQSSIDEDSIQQRKQDDESTLEDFYYPHDTEAIESKDFVKIESISFCDVDQLDHNTCVKYLCEEGFFINDKASIHIKKLRNIVWAAACRKRVIISLGNEHPQQGPNISAMLKSDFVIHTLQERLDPLSEKILLSDWRTFKDESYLPRGYIEDINDWWEPVIANGLSFDESCHFYAEKSCSLKKGDRHWNTVQPKPSGGRAVQYKNLYSGGEDDQYIHKVMNCLIPKIMVQKNLAESEACVTVMTNAIASKGKTSLQYPHLDYLLSSFVKFKQDYMVKHFVGTDITCNSLEYRNVYNRRIPWLIFVAATPSGMYLVVWHDTENIKTGIPLENKGRVYYIPYGKILILRGDTLHAGGFTSNLDELNTPEGDEYSQPRIHCYVHLKHSEKALAAKNKQNGFYWAAPGKEQNQYFSPQEQAVPFNREMLLIDKWID
jgi:hypothetical protein